MPTMILKPTPKSEKYVLWSSVVDAPVGYGTREALQSGPMGYDYTDDRFERAEQTGTSLRDGAYGWNSKYRSVIVSELGTKRKFYLLDLDNLEPFMDALFMDGNAGKEHEQKVLDEFCTMLDLDDD